MTTGKIAGRVLGLALCVAAPAGAFEMPSAARLQQVLARQVDHEADDRFGVIAVYPDQSGRVLGQAMLAQLGRQPSYLADMQRWLESNSARSEEELVQRWFRHYHAVFADSVAFLDDGHVRLLWQLKGENAIAILDRSVCRSLGPAALSDAIAGERAALVARHKDSLTAALAAAYARALAQPRAADPADAANVMLVFQDLKKSLPPDAQTALHEAFSYQPPERGPQASCEREWLASRAIGDAAIGGAPLLRASVTRSGYSAAFRMVDRLDEQKRPTDGGFKPGAAHLALPVLLARQGVRGSTALEIDLDPAGKVLALRVTAHALSPASVTSADGTVFSALALLVPELEQYYRAGTFALKQIDDVAPPSTVRISLTWR
jgi:hypothetical protein